MKKLVVIALILLVCYALSWAICTGAIWLICRCFSWNFSILPATGIWLILCLLKAVWSGERKESK